MPTTTIEKTCPACRGTGGEGGKKTVNLSDFVSGGGLCSTCKGKGVVFETVHIKESPTQSSNSSSINSTYSRPTNSSSDDGDGAAILGLIIAAIILVVVYYILIITGYAIIYALILSPILIGGWMLLTEWHLHPQWLKLTWPLTFFAIPAILLYLGVGSILDALDHSFFSLGTFEPDILTIFGYVYLVLGVVATGIIVWDVIVPYIQGDSPNSPEEIHFKKGGKEKPIDTVKDVSQSQKALSTEKYADKFKRMTPSQKKSLRLLISLWGNICGDSPKVSDETSDEELAKRFTHMSSYFDTYSPPDETLGDFLERCIKKKRDESLEDFLKRDVENKKEAIKNTI